MILIAEAGSGWAHVQDENGIGIALTGMAIVFAALAVICGFITVLPRMLGALATVFPERDHHSHAAPPTPLPAASGPAVDEATAAAIAYAWHRRGGTP